MPAYIGRVLILGLLLISGMPATLQADGLGGDWGGLRPQLQAHGLELDATYTGEFVRNLDTGLASPRKDTIYQDNLDLTAMLDSQAAGLWSGGTFFVYGLFNHGGFPSASVIGDLQAASNIEASRNQFIVHQAWYEQQIADGTASLLAGLHDLNSDFYASEFASLFLNSSFGIGPEISGNVATSLFPQAGLGMRLKLMPQDGWYVQAAAYDGDPATRSLSSTEGHMIIAEAGAQPQQGSSYKLGVWQHSADKTFGGQTFGSDYGVYALADQPLYAFSGGSDLGGFVQLGWVPKQRNEITHYLGAGLHLTGVIPLRHDDELGLAVASAYTRSGTERAVEMTWHAELYPGIALQPSMQWILNPGGNSTASTIRVALLRFEISL